MLDQWASLSGSSYIKPNLAYNVTASLDRTHEFCISPHCYRGKIFFQQFVHLLNLLCRDSYTGITII